MTMQEIGELWLTLCFEHLKGDHAETSKITKYELAEFLCKRVPPCCPVCLGSLNSNFGPPPPETPPPSRPDGSNSATIQAGQAMVAKSDGMPGKNTKYRTIEKMGAGASKPKKNRNKGNQLKQMQNEINELKQNLQVASNPPIVLADLISGLRLLLNSCLSGFQTICSPTEARGRRRQ